MVIAGILAVTRIMWAASALIGTLIFGIPLISNAVSPNTNPIPIWIWIIIGVMALLLLRKR